MCLIELTELASYLKPQGGSPKDMVAPLAIAKGTHKHERARDDSDVEPTCAHEVEAVLPTLDAGLGRAPPQAHIAARLLTCVTITGPLALGAYGQTARLLGAL